MVKFALNLIDDGLVGQQLFAGEATRLAYGTDEAVEGPGRLPGEAPARLVGVSLALLSLSPWCRIRMTTGQWGRAGGASVLCQRRRSLLPWHY